MFKKILIKGVRVKAVSALMAVMLTVVGCGKVEEDYVVDDYQNGNEASVSEKTEGDEEDGSADKKDDTKTDLVLDKSGNVYVVSGGTLAEKLGSSKNDRQLTFAEDFMIGSYSANINVTYDVFFADDEERIPSHKIKLIREEDVKENEIVKNLFGDTGKKLEGSLNDSMGDSKNLINAYYQTIYTFTGSYDFTYDVKTTANGEPIEETDECPASVDEIDYFIHTYEGLYNNKTYQLIIAYHRERCCVRIALFPKSLSEYTGLSDIDGIGYLYPMGGLYYITNEEDMTFLASIDPNRVLSDRENKCTMSDETLKDEVYKFCNEKLGLKTEENTFQIARGGIGATAVIGSTVITQSSDGTTSIQGMDDIEENLSGKVELVQMPGELDENLTGAVKSGYLLQVNTRYAGLPVIAPGFNGSRMGYYNYMVEEPYMYIADDDETAAAKNNLGSIWVDESGVAGLDVTLFYSVEELLSEDVPLLTFDNAMKCFEKEVSENMDITQLGYTRNDNKSKLYFKEAYLMSYMLPSPGDKYEFTFIPVWVINSVNNNIVQSTTVINAMDGSLIDIQY